MDLDKDIILPLLQHVITSVTLADTSQSVLALVSQQVRTKIQVDISGFSLNLEG